MGKNMNTKITTKDASESARLSLDLLCSSLTRQYLDGENNYSTSSRDTDNELDIESDDKISATAMTQDGNITFVVGGGITIEHINTLRGLQEMLRIKDEKVAELKALLVQRDAEIQELRKKLDMYRSILPFFSPYGRSTKHRPQGDF